MQMTTKRKVGFCLREIVIHPSFHDGYNTLCKTTCLYEEKAHNPIDNRNFYKKFCCFRCHLLQENRQQLAR